MIESFRRIPYAITFFLRKGDIIKHLSQSVKFTMKTEEKSGIPEFDDPGRKWDAGTGTQVGPGNRDASGTREPERRWDAGTGTQGGTREPGRRWDPGTGTQVGTGNRDTGGTQNFSD